MPEYDSTIEYREIPAFPGYVAGSDGTIWSCKWHPGNRTESWHELKYCDDNRQHYNVNLRRDGKRYATSIHRLILEAFVGPRPDGMQCRHLDGKPSNNSLTNLCWGTASENQQDRKVHGTDSTGEKHGQAKLTENDVVEMRSLRSSGVTVQALSDLFGVSATNVYRILTRKLWRHIA